VPPVHSYEGQVGGEYDDGSFYAVRWNLDDEAEGLYIRRVHRELRAYQGLRRRKVGVFCFETPAEAAAAAGRMLATGAFRAYIMGIQWLGE